MEDGGQAHPGYVNGCGWSTGMSLKDYFAAHAPVEPLWVFEVDTSGMSEEPSKKLEGWQQKQSIWLVEYNRRKYMAWPYVWADAMIAASESRLRSARQRGPCDGTMRRM